MFAALEKEKRSKTRPRRGIPNDGQAVRQSQKPSQTLHNEMLAFTGSTTFLAHTRRKGGGGRAREAERREGQEHGGTSAEVLKQPRTS